MMKYPFLAFLIVCLSACASKQSMPSTSSKSLNSEWTSDNFSIDLSDHDQDSAFSIAWVMNGQTCTTEALMQQYKQTPGEAYQANGWFIVSGGTGNCSSLNGNWTFALGSTVLRLCQANGTCVNLN